MHPTKVMAGLERLDWHLHDLPINGKSKDISTKQFYSANTFLHNPSITLPTNSTKLTLLICCYIKFTGPISFIQLSKMGTSCTIFIGGTPTRLTDIKAGVLYKDNDIRGGF